MHGLRLHAYSFSGAPQGPPYRWGGPPALMCVSSMDVKTLIYPLIYFNFIFLAFYISKKHIFLPFYLLNSLFFQSCTYTPRCSPSAKLRSSFFIFLFLQFVFFFNKWSYEQPMHKPLNGNTKERGPGGPNRGPPIRGPLGGPHSRGSCCSFNIIFLSFLLLLLHEASGAAAVAYRGPSNRVVSEVYVHLNSNEKAAISAGYRERTSMFSTASKQEARSFAFLGLFPLQHARSHPSSSSSNNNSSSSSSRVLPVVYKRVCMRLYGARSNRINGKRPSVLSSPSPFPGAILHLLQQCLGIPNAVYTGQHVRLPITPSADLSLAGGPRGPPRLYPQKPLHLNARNLLMKKGLPLTTLKYPEDAEQQQQQQQQQQEQQEQQEEEEEGVRTLSGHRLTVEYLSKQGDKYTEKHKFGEEAPLFKHHLFFGKPPWPLEVAAAAKEYNEECRRNNNLQELVPEQWICVNPKP